MEPVTGKSVEKFVTIGADVGQKQDPTAICIVEARRVVVEKGEGWIIPAGRVLSGMDIRPVPDKVQTVYFARSIERLPLQTPYPKVAERIAAIARGLRNYGVTHPRLVVDATGVGGPVVELIADALRGLNVDLVAATFTHGQNYTKGKRGNATQTASVGKAFLVSRLQALLQTRRLKLPDTQEAKALAKELEIYEIKIDEDGGDKYGAFRVGTHDDLATALGLSVLDDPFIERVRNALCSC